MGTFSLHHLAALHKKGPLTSRTQTMLHFKLSCHFLHMGRQCLSFPPKLAFLLHLESFFHFCLCGEQRDAAVLDSTKLNCKEVFYAKWYLFVANVFSFLSDLIIWSIYTKKCVTKVLCLNFCKQFPAAQKWPIRKHSDSSDHSELYVTLAQCENHSTVHKLITT